MRLSARSRVVGFSMCLPLLGVSPAFADGPYANELSKCLVRSTTDADKSILVQWIFATVALHPDVKWMANVSDGQRADVNKKAAGLFQRLLTVSCVDDARQAIKYEGQGALSTSFSVLGQVATRELFADPGVAAGLAELGKQVDSETLRKALGLDK